MSKSKVYLNMIRDAVNHSRNISANSITTKVFDKSAYFELELVHNLFNSINTEEITESDIYFLNHQAKWYLENCSEQISPNFEENKRRIKEILSMVPDDLRLGLIIKADL